MDKLFFDLQSTHNPHRWYLPVEPRICVGPPASPFMFGGVGLASAVAAMERTCGRPLIWATAQYLSFAKPPSVVDLDVWTPVQGKYNSQARVIGHVDDKEIITVNAALGARPSELSGQWADKPDAPPPEDCDAADEQEEAPKHGRARKVEHDRLNEAAGALAAGTFPVYALAATHRGPYKNGPGEIHVPVSIGGMIVYPNDIIVGDEDGLVAIRPDEAPALLAAARAWCDKEEKMLKAIRAGKPLDRKWVDEALRKGGCGGVD